MTGRPGPLREAVRTGFWAIPAGCVVLAVVLAVLILRLDRSMDKDLAFTFGAGPDGAREVLSAISTSMITFTGLVFSITIVVLQLTSSQFSPRVLRTFLRDRQTQLSLGTFVATFVYSMTVLRTVNSGNEDAFVPAAATTVALALLLVSVGVFVGYIHHVATAIQVSSILASIGAETCRTIDERYPPGDLADQTAAGRTVDRPGGPPSAVVPARESGVVTYLDTHRLVRLAERADVVLRTGLRPGSFVPQGAPMLEIIGDPAALDVAAVTGAVVLSRERTMQQDVAFGIRQLVDIAERALSPGTNDPTTAVQALDQLHDVLRRLATRNLGDGLYRDSRGRPRLATTAETLNDYFELAIGEIEQYGRDARQVRERVAALREDVLASSSPAHREALLSGRPPAQSSSRSADPTIPPRR